MIDVSPETALAAAILPETSNPRRRVRVALHLCLERAQTVAQLFRELDALAIWLCGHGDPEAGSLLLEVADTIREEIEQ